MSKNWTPRRQTVDLQAPAQKPSRIRREPVRADKAESLDKVQWRSAEWEIRMGVFGIVLFALAVQAIWFGVNQILQ